MGLLLGHPGLTGGRVGGLPGIHMAIAPLAVNYGSCRPAHLDSTHLGSLSYLTHRGVQNEVTDLECLEHTNRDG